MSAGLDIGASSIKLVKLKFLKETVELAACEIVASQPDNSTLIENLVQKHSLDRVNISVSGSGVVTRYALFPKMQPQELNQSLKFEAQKHIPFDINDVYLDAHILKTDLADNKMLVLVCAVKKDSVDPRLKLYENLGLRVNVIDIDCLCVINSFLFNYSDEREALKTFALLNVGAKVSNLGIVDEGLPGLNRDIHIGGDNFTRGIQDALQLDIAQAEAIKINPDPAHAAAASAAAESVVSSLAAEIRTSFDYYESQNASSVGKILLSGAASQLTGFRDSLANMLGIEVDYWDPLRRLIFGAGLDAQKLKAFAPQLAVCVGLALR
ncbi:MAG: type IV pilus assembly protein PilM [Candidatus Omnitrophica bacterium]|nr:type IV pilus assembly protein PilM [Candidatus Omnitrophota bacterium]